MSIKHNFEFRVLSAVTIKFVDLPLLLRLADSGSITSKKYFSSVSLMLSFKTGRSQLRGKLHAPPLLKKNHAVTSLVDYIINDQL